MAVVTTKSASILGLDATPILANTTGEGATGIRRVVTDSVVGNVGDSIGSIYRLVRLPSNAKIKRVWLATGVSASATSAADIDIAYSDNPNDYNASFLNSVVAANPIVQTPSADNRVFGAGVTLNGASALPVVAIDRTFQNLWTPALQNTPLWAALVALGTTGFTADPGGFFDLVLKLTAAVATGAITFSAEVDYVE
jgi:hypothetical protein